LIRGVLRRLKRLVFRPAGGGADIEGMLRLVDDRGRPNVNALWQIAKDMEALRLNVKMLGYSMAGVLEQRLQRVMVEPQPEFLLESKGCTQADIESRWFRYWCDQLQERPRFHRRLWELAFVMQALHAAGATKAGGRALSLTDGAQPIPSILAGLGAEVVVATQPGQPLYGKGEHDPLMDDRYVDRPAFLTQVRRRHVDLQALPPDLDGFDAVWSIGMVSHRGSIASGQDLMRRSMACLRPGGVAVHVFDFNVADDERTLDNWSHVLFQRRDVEALAAAFRDDGHEVSPLDFNAGFQEMDRFVDLPPFDIDRTPAFDRLWRDGWQAAHLKVMVDGFITTSFGIVVRKAR
jgi:hypothetical protein